MARLGPALSSTMAVAALLLGSCAPSGRDIQLSAVDLSDPDEVGRIRTLLAADDRAYFATYVARHVTSSSAFCGRELALADGSKPRTVGEAIDLTIARSEAEKRVASIAGRVLAPEPGPLRDLQELLDARRQWADTQANMTAFYGADVARSRPEWEESERQLALYDKRLAEARAALGEAPLGLMVK